MISSEQILDLIKRSNDLYKYLSIEEKEKELSNLERKTQKNNFWENAKAAQKALQKISKLKLWINSYNKVKTNIEELKILEEFAKDGECADNEVIEQFKLSLKLLEDAWEA